MSDPTNRDILQAFEVYKAEDKAWKKQVDKRLISIESHAEYTNGKVAGLVEQDIRRNERDKIRSEVMPTITAQTVNVQQKWFTTPEGKQVLAGIGVILVAIAGVISAFKWSGL